MGKNLATILVAEGVTVNIVSTLLRVERAVRI